MLPIVVVLTYSKEWKKTVETVLVSTRNHQTHPSLRKQWKQFWKQLWFPYHKQSNTPFTKKTVETVLETVLVSTTSTVLYEFSMSKIENARLENLPFFYVEIRKRGSYPLVFPRPFRKRGRRDFFFLNPEVVL